MQKILNWIDQRFPLTALWKSQVSEYYAPKNFNFWYFFGSLAMLILAAGGTSGASVTFRNLPDVSWTANNVTAFYNNGTEGCFGGTSAAAPLWAGLAALVNQQALAAGKGYLGMEIGRA